MRFLILPNAKRWPCRLEDRCTTPAVAVVIADKDYVPACLGHMVELAEACRRIAPKPPRHASGRLAPLGFRDSSVALPLLAPAAPGPPSLK